MSLKLESDLEQFVVQPFTSPTAHFARIPKSKRPPGWLSLLVEDIARRFCVVSFLLFGGLFGSYFIVKNVQRVVVAVA